MVIESWLNERAEQHQSRPAVRDLHGDPTSPRSRSARCCCRWATPRASACSRSPRSRSRWRWCRSGSPPRPRRSRSGRCSCGSAGSTGCRRSAWLGCFFVGLAQRRVRRPRRGLRRGVGLSHHRHRAVHERRPDRRRAGPAAARAAVRPHRPAPGLIAGLPARGARRRCAGGARRRRTTARRLLALGVAHRRSPARRRS